MHRYMDEWDEEYEEALQRAELEADENDEEFDEDEWRHRRMYPDTMGHNDTEFVQREDLSEIDESINGIIRENEIDEAIDEVARGTEEAGERDYYDGLFDHSPEEEEQEADKEVQEYPEDPWAKDDHRQRTRKGSGHHSSNGLRLAEQNAGDFYDYAHTLPDDGHGISVPRLTAFEKSDSQKTFKLPDSREERHAQKMERVSQKYRTDQERNDDGSESPYSDDYTRADEWFDSLLSSKSENEEESYEPEKQLTDYEEDILEKAEERILDFFSGGTEDDHYKKLRDDSHYRSTAEYETYSLHQELKHKLEMYEERMGEDPHDNTYYLPHVLGAMEAIDNAQYLYSRNHQQKGELQEKHEAGKLSDMQYEDQMIALDFKLHRRLTTNAYEGIAAGSSMFGDVGETMDHWNNLVDDTLSGDPEKLQDVRNFIGQLPREVAEKFIDEALEEGTLDRHQADHLMTMAARPTYSLNHAQNPKKYRFMNKAKRFFGL